MVKNMKGDASGRGISEGFKICSPARQHPYTEEEIAAVVNVMRNVDCQTQGDNLARFEEAFKEFTGANYAFAVDNATNALYLSAVLCRIQPGDEVIVPAYTFCASAIPFAKNGAKLVWADIDPVSWTIDPADVEKKITDKTKAIVVVHLLGMPADVEKICEIAKKHNLKVVEDCAQALDCRIHGQHVGTFGDFGCFSFHGAKTMTTLGEGGMLLVKSEADAALTPGIRHNGCCSWNFERDRYWVPAMSSVDSDIDGVWPNNFCIGEAQCALGVELLKSLKSNTDIIIAQAQKIWDKMADTPEISFGKARPDTRNVVHQFIMHFDGSAFGKNRNDLLDILTTKYGIKAIVQYYPLYRYPLFQKNGQGDFDCPVLEKWWDNSFSFPWWCGMSDEDIDYLCDSLKAAIAELKA